MFLLLISGASASGKTTIAKLLQRKLNVSILSVDQYYRDLVDGEERNWDDISAVDMNELYENVLTLSSGCDANVPTYNYELHKRNPDKITLQSPKILIIEGIFALCDKRLRDLADLKLYIDANPTKICLKRRLKRDGSERGRETNGVIEQYMSDVLPGYEKFILPYKKYADIVYINECEIPDEHTKIIDILCTWINVRVNGGGAV